MKTQRAYRSQWSKIYWMVVGRVWFIKRRAWWRPTSTRHVSRNVLCLLIRLDWPFSRQKRSETEFNYQSEDCSIVKPHIEFNLVIYLPYLLAFWWPAIAHGASPTRAHSISVLMAEAYAFWSKNFSVYLNMSWEDTSVLVYSWMPMTLTVLIHAQVILCGLAATFRHRRSALARLICISPPRQGGAIFSPFSPCDSTALSIVLLFAAQENLS